ncbi:hypothetical protein EF900_18270, partial [Staphylococcus aureus]
MPIVMVLSSVIQKVKNRSLQRMFTDAEKDGVSLYKISGFRSYETQVNLYN